MDISSRAGRWLQQPSGYRAFVPAPLPPDPALILDDEMLALLSRADRALGRLDGVTSILPNPDLFVAMVVRQEAVLSSQIEGTQSTLEDVLEFEAGADAPGDVEEIVNYIRAMNHGLKRLNEFPLFLPLIKEIHGILLEGTRGAGRDPGEFRRSQNWIGAPGATLLTASFVPPPVPEKESLHQFEKWLHADSLPTLLHCGLAHAQFETIHPFLDGNGRVGRLLITFLLCQREILERPLLYLSLYLKRHRSEYYDRLSAVRFEGNWEGWLKFFLRGVAEVSLSATQTARAILELRERGRIQLLAQGGNTTHSTRLFDFLFEQPVVTTSSIREHLECSYNTASNLVTNMTSPELGFLEQIGNAQRNRRYRFAPYLALWENPPGFETIVEDVATRQTTRSANV